MGTLSISQVLGVFRDTKTTAQREQDNFLNTRYFSGDRYSLGQFTFYVEPNNYICFSASSGTPSQLNVTGYITYTYSYL